VIVRVTFYKLVERRLSTWEALRGKRTRVVGPTMALGRGDLPHDLVQFIVEAALGIEHGFWGCVADGASFRSLRRKRTKPGRGVIAAHRKELDAAEYLIAHHLARWKAGAPTPAAEPLESIGRAWRALRDGDALTLRWPDLDLIPTAPAAERRARTSPPLGSPGATGPGRLARSGIGAHRNRVPPAW
jgi:hypothetical protein